MSSATNTASAAASTVKNAASATTTVASTAASRVKTAASTAASTVKTAASTAASTVKTAASTAASTVKTATSTAVSGIQNKVISNMMIIKWFFIAVIVGLVIWGIVALVRKVDRAHQDAKQNVSTPENNARIIKEQLEIFNPIYIQREKLSAYQMEKNGLKTKNITIPPLAKAETALINYSILTCNNAGYIGPLVNGVFAEQEAIDLAYKAGCRAFMLHIDFLDGTRDPVLMVRNASGDKISNNVGSIERTIKAIANGIPRGSEADPIIIILFVHRLPGKDAHHPHSINFMSNIARGLDSLRSKLLGMTAEGDFSRQKQQDTLFIKSRDVFDGKFVIMTNVDTTGFRNKKLVKNLPISQDLDYWIHARIRTNSSKNLHLVTQPTQSRSISPIAETLNFFNNIPADRQAEQIARTKVQWTIAMNNFIETNPDTKTLDLLLNKSGVACIPINIFDKDTKSLIENVFANEFFGRTGYRPKPKELRFIKPEPVELGMAPASLNAYGGRLPIPGVSDGPFSKTRGEFKELQALGGHGCKAMVEDTGNFVIRDRNGRPRWSSNTAAKAVNYSRPFRGVMQQDGNLVIRDSNNSAIWAANSGPKKKKDRVGPYTFTMQDDCNAVVYNGRGKGVWSTKTRIK
jgi:hypothetical protein